MKIVLIHNSKIPVFLYGGIERVIWDLGFELTQKGHRVVYLVPKGSVCPFADVLVLDFSKSINDQIPADSDFVHLHFHPNETIQFPHLITIHGNMPADFSFFRNTSFVSKNHAERYGADAFVYNGLNWDLYEKPELSNSKNYVHFLGKAAWRIKNVRGAIKIAHKNKTEIKILGGSRVNLKMGFRFTLSKYARFYGMVGGTQKMKLLKYSKGLIFPVKWHEPFGLAIIESLYFGCPVLGTKFGALPELISRDYGCLSNSLGELVEAFENLDSYNRKKCFEYAVDNFSSKVMAENYLKLYSKLLNNEKINSQIPVFQPEKNSVGTQYL